MNIACALIHESRRANGKATLTSRAALSLNYHQKSALKRGLSQMSKQNLFNDLVSRLESAGVEVVSFRGQQNSVIEQAQPPTGRHLVCFSNETPTHESGTPCSAPQMPLMPMPDTGLTP